MWYIADCYAGGYGGRRYSCIDFTYIHPKGGQCQRLWTRYSNELDGMTLHVSGVVQPS